MEQNIWVIRPRPESLIYRLLQQVWGYNQALSCHCLRLMPAIAAAAAAGAGAVVRPERVWLCPAAAVFLVMLCRCCRIEPAWLTLAAPVVFLCSAVHAGCVLLPSEHLAGQLAGREFVLQGKVCPMASQTEESRQVFVRRSDGIRILLVGIDMPLLPGCQIAAEAEGILPSAAKNPGGFDEAAWLAAQGVHLKARLQENTRISILQAAPAFNPTAWGMKVRKQFQQFSGRMLGSDASALLSGLLLGDTRLIRETVQSDFRRAGLSHLTSVSGSNVALLLLPFSRLLKRSQVRRKIRLLILAGFLAGFGFLTGWQVSVTRAILMTACVLAGQMLHRRAETLNALASAALFLVLFDPLTVASPGFWLSLTATAAILLFSAPLASQLRSWIPLMPESWAAVAAATLCAQAAVLPLSSQLSREISIWGFLANLPAVPLAAGISLLSVMLLPASFLFGLLPDPAAAGALAAAGQPLAIGLHLLQETAMVFGRLQIGRLFASQLNPAFWLAWIALCASAFRKSPCLANWPRIIFIRAAKIRLPAAGAWIFLNVLALLTRPAVTVWFLDVNQGDAILVQTWQNETLLVDGGNLGCGPDVLLPAMDALGVSQIDWAVATHGHADHTGGLIELAEAGKITRLLIPVGLTQQDGGIMETDLGGKLVAISRTAGIPVSELAGHDTIVLNSLVRLEVLDSQPVNSDMAASVPDGNDLSLILLAQLAGRRVLLTADCTQDAESRLLTQSSWPAAEVLKVAHHGSRLATSARFLDCVRPAAAIISVGPNVYGHPAAEVLERLDQTGCQVLRTDRQGAVKLAINRRNWEIRSMLP